MSKLHIDLLILLRASAVYGLDLDTMLADLRQQRHRELTVPQLERAARDLADRSLVEPFTSPLGKKRWRILEQGSSALNQEGL